MDVLSDFQEVEVCHFLAAFVDRCHSLKEEVLPVPASMSPSIERLLVPSQSKMYRSGVEVVLVITIKELGIDVTPTLCVWLWRFELLTMANTNQRVAYSLCA